MSSEAMKWAMETAPPMPAQLVATLTGLAYHADRHGRGAYPSVARLAALTCKAERSVQRDLKQLRELKLIRLGDQSKAAHLPAGKRPEVYDLAMERTVPGGRAGDDEVTSASRVTLASSRERGRAAREAKKARQASSEVRDIPERGDVDVRGDAHVTGDVHVADGVTSTSPKGRRPRHPNQLQNQEQKASQLEHPAPSALDYGIPDDARPLVDGVTEAIGPILWPFRGDGWFPVLALIAKCGVPAMVRQARRAGARTDVESATYLMRVWSDLPPLPPARDAPSNGVRRDLPPHCGECDPDDRLREHLRDGLPELAPCPNCHPTTQGATP